MTEEQENGIAAPIKNAGELTGEGGFQMKPLYRNAIYFYVQLNTLALFAVLSLNGHLLDKSLHEASIPIPSFTWSMMDIGLFLGNHCWLILIFILVLGMSYYIGRPKLKIEGGTTYLRNEVILLGLFLLLEMLGYIASVFAWIAALVPIIPTLPVN